MLEQIKEKIEDSYYWDARVKSLECNYFRYEVKLVYENDKKDITYYFDEYYSVQIKHALECPKDKVYRELTIKQIPYFMQNVELTEIFFDEKKYMKFTINMHPIELEIICNKFNIYYGILRYPLLFFCIAI